MLKSWSLHSWLLSHVGIRHFLTFCKILWGLLLCGSSAGINLRLFFLPGFLVMRVLSNFLVVLSCKYLTPPLSICPIYQSELLRKRLAKGGCIQASLIAHRTCTGPISSCQMIIRLEKNEFENQFITSPIIKLFLLFPCARKKNSNYWAWAEWIAFTVQWLIFYFCHWCLCNKTSTITPFE